MAKQLVPAPDIKDTVNALKAKYPTTLEDVDTERILFWRDMSAKKGKKKTYAYVQKVNEMDKMVNPNYDYHFVANADHFDKCSPAQQNVVVLSVSLNVGGNAIDANGVDHIKIRDHDVKDHYLVLATFGIDYQTNDTVRDPLADDVTFVERPKDDDLETDGIEDNPNFV